jgi:hypothetical protein
MDEIWQKMQKMPYGKNYSYQFYKPEKNNFPNVGLVKTDMEFLLEQRLREGLNYLKDQFPDLPSYPLEARTGLSDLEYNIGPVRFRRKKWSKLWDAVERRDWAAAAKESHRVTPNERRNVETELLFLNAEKHEKKRR